MFHTLNVPDTFHVLQFHVFLLLLLLLFKMHYDVILSHLSPKSIHFYLSNRVVSSEAGSCTGVQVA